MDGEENRTAQAPAVPGRERRLNQHIERVYVLVYERDAVLRRPGPPEPSAVSATRVIAAVVGIRQVLKRRQEHGRNLDLVGASIHSSAGPLVSPRIGLPAANCGWGRMVQ